MKSQPPAPKPAWMIDQLVEALNHMCEAWTRAAFELRDLQFDLDTAQRQDTIEHTNDLVNKVKAR